MTRYEALMKVRAFFATEQDMADAFGVTQPTIWRWLNQSKQIPGGQAAKAQQLTGVSVLDLRPDVFPRDVMVDRNVSARFVGVDRDAARLRA